MAKTLTEEQISTKRAELIKVAVKILEEEGFVALTLRRLATDAGISRTTPYLYFDDKADLLQKMCVETFKYLMNICQTAMDGQDGVDNKMTAMGRSYMKFGLEKPTLYRLIFAPENPTDEIPIEVLQISDEFRAMAFTPMQEAYDAGLYLYPPERLNAVLWACMHGLLSMKWAGHLSEEGAFAQVQADMENILTMGFLDKTKIDLPKG